MMKEASKKVNDMIKLLKVVLWLTTALFHIGITVFVIWLCRRLKLKSKMNSTFSCLPHDSNLLMLLLLRNLYPPVSVPKRIRTR